LPLFFPSCRLLAVDDAHFIPQRRTSAVFRHNTSEVILKFRFLVLINIYVTQGAHVIGSFRISVPIGRIDMKLDDSLEQYRAIHQQHVFLIVIFGQIDHILYAFLPGGG